MSYKIEEIDLKEFVAEESDYKLPRYQRQKRWSSKKNFELAISIFQDYPIGVLIIDERDGKDWLLDGRQRQNALEKMVNDPTELYWWARDYIGFNEGTTEDDVTEAFWKDINRFIKKDDKKTSNKKRLDKNDDDDDDDDYDDDDDTNEGSVEEEADKEDDAADVKEEVVINESQRKRLGVLLDLVLMVHKIKPKSESDRWENVFDFKGNGVNPTYCEDNGIDVPALKKFIIRYVNSLEDGYPSEETFREYCESRFNARGCKDLEDLIRNSWSTIKYSTTTIKAADDIFRKVKIGAIKLERLDFLDSLNIFSRVNSKGVPLKVEELLSANPFWNEPVEKVSEEVEDAVSKMYRNLGISRFVKFVRWDIVATLIPRLEDKLVLTQIGEEKGRFVGFKLLSSIYSNGMSKRHLTDLQEKGEILEKEVFTFPNVGKNRGNKGEEVLLRKLKSFLKFLYKDKFFTNYAKGRKSILDLLGHAPTLEFITVLFNSWKDKGEPEYRDKDEVTMGIQKDARVLFDRLIFEQLNDDWKGSGDSKMARHIVDWKNRLAEAPVPYSEWEEKITFACEVKKTQHSLNSKKLTPVLYYFEALRGGFWSNDNLQDESYHVDHIIPQKILKNKYLNTNGYNKDCLANLELLAKTKNEEKKDKALNELGDLTEVVARAAGGANGGLDPKDFKGKYSDQKEGFKNLVEDRKAIFLELLRTNRQKLVGLPEVVEDGEPQAGTTA